MFLIQASYSQGLIPPCRMLAICTDFNINCLCPAEKKKALEALTKPTLIQKTVTEVILIQLLLHCSGPKWNHLKPMKLMERFLN